LTNSNPSLKFQIGAYPGMDHFPAWINEDLDLVRNAIAGHVPDAEHGEEDAAEEAEAAENADETDPQKKPDEGKKEEE
jgi:hypothetical protein